MRSYNVNGYYNPTVPSLYHKHNYFEAEMCIFNQNNLDFKNKEDAELLHNYFKKEQNEIEMYDFNNNSYMDVSEEIANYIFRGNPPLTKIPTNNFLPPQWFFKDFLVTFLLTHLRSSTSFLHEFHCGCI